MDSAYHIQLLTEAIGSFFDRPALEEIIAANLGQDAFRYLLGGYPQFHFDNNEIAKSLAYVEQEHGEIVKLAAAGESGAVQRAAFGRLSHAIHDFYAHSNYVDLWLEANGGLANTSAEQINGVDAVLLQHPRLFTASFILWFDSLYYIPGFRPILRSIYLRPNSHEAMHLDDPGQGPKFDYAMHAAKQRTVVEYERAKNALLAIGGAEALHRFHNS